MVENSTCFRRGRLQPSNASSSPPSSFGPHPSSSSLSLSLSSSSSDSSDTTTFFTLHLPFSLQSFVFEVRLALALDDPSALFLRDPAALRLLELSLRSIVAQSLTKRRRKGICSLACYASVLIGLVPHRDLWPWQLPVYMGGEGEVMENTLPYPQPHLNLDAIICPSSTLGLRDNDLFPTIVTFPRVRRVIELLLKSSIGSFRLLEFH